MARRRTFGAVMALAMAATGTVAVVGAAPAGALPNAPIVVTTTSDVIDGSDGVLSLREAVALANATAGDDTIQLADGATYDLAICPVNGGETDNAVGDLNGSGSDALTITGSPSALTPPTIHQTCSERVIAQATGLLTLAHLAVTGGSWPGGGSIRAGGALTLDHVDESGAVVGGSDADAAVYVVGRPLSIVDSSIHDNTGGGLFLAGTGTPDDTVVRRSSISDNVGGSSYGGGIYTFTSVTIDQSTISGNTGGRVVGGVGAFHAVVTDSTISGNGGGHAGGLFGEFSLTDSVVTDNSGGSPGGNGTGGGGMGKFTVLRSTVSGNHSGILAGGLLGVGSVTDSVVSGNDATGIGGGIVAEPSASYPNDPSVAVTNSTITGNVAHLAGGILVLDDWYDGNYPGHPVPVPPTHQSNVVISSSTVVGNTVLPFESAPPVTNPTPATDITFARYTGEPVTNVVGGLTVTTSVIGDGASSDPACSLAMASPVTSGGYNFSADGSCGSGAGAGDVAAGGDPGLSGLADHGGPTLTLAPTVGSPLLDRIPVGFSSCAGQLDQRGVARPVGGLCDVGAVESDAAVWPAEREFTPIVPQRLMDTRGDAAYHVGSQHRFGPGETQSLVVAGGTSPVPVDATAVVVNVTAVGPDDWSHVDVWPTGTSQPNVSNLNFVPGQTVPNLVKVKVGAGGAISLFNRNGHVDVIVDVVGYYRGDATAARYTPVVPNRITDTRADPVYHVGSLTRLGDHTDVRSLTVTGATTGVPVGAKAIIANVTVVGPSASSHLDVWPDGTSHPNVSNLNYTAGQTVANLVVVKVSAGGKIDLVNANGSTDVIVDIVGYFTVDPTASGFVAVSPHRLADTRADPAYHVGSQLRLGDRTDTRAFVVTGGTVPADATAIVANITVVGPSTASHLDVWPAGSPHPNVSNLNYTAGQTVPNLVTVKIGTGGAIDLQNQNGSTDVIIDIVGYYR